MAEWIVFDERSAEILAGRNRRRVKVGVGEPFEVALASGAPSVVLYPGESGSTRVITIRHGDIATQLAHPDQYVAAGFLGLQDEIADPEPPRKQTFWQKYFGRD